MQIVTLTTDFGTGDYYVGAMKGAILRIAPDAHLVDISHDIPPRDVLAAAFVLGHAASEFPPGTVHLAVVDPGVGRSRQPLALQSDDHLWVGPDNGLFSFALDGTDARAHHIANTELFGPHQSHTFHGRDIFAPVAAHLCCGLELAKVGPLLSDPVRLAEAAPRKSARCIEGQIIHIDRFGNLVTNISIADIEAWGQALRIRCGNCVLEGLSATYADVEMGTPLALIGSADLLEVSVSSGNAARQLGLKRRETVIVEKTT